MTVIDNVIYNVVEVKRPVFEYPPANYADSDDDDADERKQKTAYAQGGAAGRRLRQGADQAAASADHASSCSHDMEGQLLPVPEHVVLNHLYVLPSPDQQQLLITGITQRFKPNSHTQSITHKFVTTVYYQPKPTGDSAGPVGMGLAASSASSSSGSSSSSMQYQQYAGSALANGSMHGAMMG